MGGRLILAAKKTIGTLSRSKAAVGSPTINWKPHKGKIPQKIP